MLISETKEDPLLDTNTNFEIGDIVALSVDCELIMEREFGYWMEGNDKYIRIWWPNLNRWYTYELPIGSSSLVLVRKGNSNFLVKLALGML